MSFFRMQWSQRLGLGLLTSLLVCTGCGSRPKESSATVRASAVAAPSSAAKQPVSPKPATPSSVLAAAPAPAAAALPTPPAATLPTPGPAAAHGAESGLRLKRLVVATGVKDREPIVVGDALPSDGSAIYAFAELANPAAGSENVRITFERKGGAERVGDVTLPVPGNVSRHRTWAFTRFIRAPGVWEAVLWSESGAELGRTSFEVKAS